MVLGTMIQPFCTIHCGEPLTAYVLGMAGKGRQVLIRITDHFSMGGFHRDGAGCSYNSEAAMAHTYHIKRQISHTFGGDH